jgi:thiol-disulfide isomerase/thioredoxin
MHKLLLAVVVLALVPFTSYAQVDQSKPLDLKYTALDGSTVDLSKLRGKVVLVDFWATWCPPCRGEVPNVVAAYQKYHDKGFDIVGVSLDQDKDALVSFTKEHGMVWPQYFDGQGWDNKVSKSFGIDSIPAMWLVGKDGKVITTDAREDLDGNVANALGAK